MGSFWWNKMKCFYSYVLFMYSTGQPSDLRSTHSN